uniref:DCAF15_WD40 domain-containing protein n=1 Tax=Syphacia muris TaxID=451379 RepID=A0A0N5AH79_9BILA
MVTEWYNLLKSTRSVPLARASKICEPISECYAVTFKNIEFSNLKIGVYYRLHTYFFDKLSKAFFGRPYYAAWHRSNDNIVDISHTIFFHSIVNDDNIFLVVELVECEDPYSEQLPDINCTAWTITPISSLNKPLTDYGNADISECINRFQFYTGTPKQLFFCEKHVDLTTNLRKINGILELCLQTNYKMYDVLDYIPAFCIVSSEDRIPGVIIGGYPGNYTFREDQIFTCKLSSILLTFDFNFENFEKAFLHLINNDRLYRLNLSSNDTSVKPLKILERQLKIGLHNGYKYVEEPEIMHLVSASKNSRYSMKGLSKALPYSSLQSRPQRSLLAVRNNVLLTRLTKHPQFAIVFTLNYLVGVSENDETVFSSQTVMICWSAWCPFKTNLYQQNIKIFFIGGPRLNPDHRLTFHNVANLSDSMSALENNISDDYVSRIQLQFTFELEQKQNDQQRLNPSADEHQNHIDLERLPNDDSDGFQRPPLDDTSTKPNVHYPQRNGNVLLTKTLCPSRVPTVAWTPIASGTISGLWFSNVSRKVQAILSEKPFTEIIDRNGNKPEYVAVDECLQLNIETEKADVLSTNEVILQFQALTFNLTELSSFAPPQRVYFTVYFYRFEAVNTDRMLLKYDDDASRNTSAKNNQLGILHRLDIYENLIDTDDYGLTMKFTVDQSSLRDGEEDDFVMYLLNNDLIIEVWDADSLLLFGVTAIPLKFLLRQTREAVVSMVQAKLVNTSIPETAEQTGILFIKLACIGYPPTNIGKNDSMRRRTIATVNHRLKCLGQNELNSYRIRAKPLNPIHDSAMQRFMSVQKLDIKQRYKELFCDNSVKKLLSMANSESDKYRSAVKSSVRNLIFHEELEAYKQMRNETKPNKLLKAVFNSITTVHKIYPSYGEVEYFEFLLQNTIAEPINVVVEITEPTLKLVRDAEMWTFLKHKSNIYSTVERDLFHVVKNSDQSLDVHIFLNPMESVYVPFVYDSFDLPINQSSNNVKALFKKWDDGEPIAILDVVVELRNHILTEVHHYYQQAQTKIIKIVDIKQLPIALGQKFMILLYGDKYKFELLSVWSITIHPTFRINVNAIQAQVFRIPLTIQSNDDQLFQVFSSSPLLNVSIPQQLCVGGKTESTTTTALFTPSFSGKRTFILSAVSVSSRQLLAQWLLYTTVTRPNISKTFELSLLTDTTETKNITIDNKYTVAKEYRLISSQPHILHIEMDYLVLEPKESATVSITFLPYLTAGTVELLLFVINAEDELEEETYLFSILYNNQ